MSCTLYDGYFVLTHCQTELVKYLTIDHLQFKLECVLFMHLAYPNQIPTSVVVFRFFMQSMNADVVMTKMGRDQVIYASGFDKLWAIYKGR